MSFLKNVRGDVRTNAVGLIMAGVVAILGPILASLMKVRFKENIPWIAFTVVVLAGVVLISFAIYLLRKMPPSTEENLEIRQSPPLIPPAGSTQHGAARFETFQPQIKYQEAIRKFEASIGFRNIGEVDATDVDCSLWMSDCFFARHSQIRAHQSSQDVPPTAHRFFNLTFGITKPRIDPHFVVFTISYRSGQETEPREQKFYYRWYGIKNDVTRDTLEIVSRDERAKIDRRIQDEISGVPLKPIEIRNSLDRLIEDAGEILVQWKGSQDAIATDNMQDMALSWIRAVEDFVKRNLEVRHVDQLRGYGTTLTPEERYKITFDLESAGLAWQRFPVAHKLASKSQVLSHFRREIV